jgi:4-alpha-glucanotransferase
MKTIQLVFAVHNHQPVGNFDHVFAKAYEDGYKPFLDLMARHPKIPFCAHFSGCLLDWLAANRLEVFLQMEKMVQEGRLEMIGGGFYEPIFSMLPERDRVGQVEMMSDFLRKRFGCAVKGAWIPERIWEQRVVSSLAAAGIEYTVVDDYHFKSAGVYGDRLLGPYLTEDQGRLLTVFNIHERLRYMIPFENEVGRIFDYLKGLATEDGRRVVVYADDGEKFGVWPNTRQHVFEHGWLERFLSGLEANADWLRVTTFSRALVDIPPVDRIYLPVTSYREMGEWALPTEAAIEYHRQVDRLKREGSFEALAPFLRAGIWHNFRMKYPESNWMYGRMLDVSDQVEQLPKRGKAYPGAQADLYKGQCNCGYWHGQFGGLYLPHLRAALYHHLIAAESQAVAAAAAPGKRPAATYRERDIDLDGHPEVVLSSDALNVIVAPARGGQVMEIDLRDKRFNILASLARRKEWYHPAMVEKARQSRSAAAQGAASIHDGVAVNRGDLEENLFEDAHLRASLVDHFYDPAATLDDVAASRAEEQGDFVHGAYAPEAHKTDGGVRLRLERVGAIRRGEKRIPLRVEKVLELDAAANELVAQYTLVLTGKAAAEVLFAVELNFAMLSDDGGQRYFHAGNRKSIGTLGARLDLAGRRQLYLVDAWQGIEVAVTCSPPADLWTYPVRTVSQSEAEYELNYQSTVVLPRWKVQLEPGKPWQVRLAQRFGHL